MTSTVATHGNGEHQLIVGAKTAGAVRGYASGKDDYLARLSKIEGQVRGLRKMVEDDRWCPDIVTQVSSVTRALQEVSVGLLNDHIHCCVVDAVRRSSFDGEAALDEVASTIRQVMKQ